MDVEKVREYVGKKVMLILKNNYNFTTVIPPFNGTSFDIIDKFGAGASIECEMISMIYEKGESD